MEGPLQNETPTDGDGSNANPNENDNSNTPLSSHGVIEFGGQQEASLYTAKDDGTNAKEKDVVDDYDNDEVMRLAARLAPAFEEAHDMFQVPEEFAKASGEEHHGMMGSGLEDDDLKREISDLEHSEQLLRQELEQATFFSSFLASPSSKSAGLQDDETSTSSIATDTEPDSFPSVGEADIGSSDYDTPEQNLELPPIDEETHEINPTTNSIKKKQEKQKEKQKQQTPVTPNSPSSRAVYPTQSEPSPRISTDANVVAVRTPSSASPAVPPAPILVMGRQPVTYQLDDHKEAIGVSVENGWFMANMNRFFLPSQLRSLDVDLPGVSDFVIACPEQRLKTSYIGFEEMSAIEKENMVSVLPVRTSIIRIRPDVLCGAVMDAVVAASATLVDAVTGKAQQHTILRRQGGHLKLSVTTADENVQFLVDAQLCVCKSNHCERVLLVRIFHHVPVVGRSPTISDASPQQAIRRSSFEWGDEIVPEACLYLREASALVQRIEIQATNETIGSPRRHIKFRPAQSPSMSDRDAMQNAFTKHLQKTYKACPSTKEHRITLPALNSEDWHLIASSWKWFEAVWEELEARRLTFSSLQNVPFGTFPCLPTLDAHYCSQIRRYSRESMVQHLLKNATQLEEYARDSEYACANVIALLQKAYREYGVDPPPLPVPIPLTSYKLDYANPQAVCPPWGLKVAEALNQIQAWVDETGQQNRELVAELGFGGELQDLIKSSMALASRSVAAVLEAFQRQDDEEKGARLQRKNSQVMDRLTCMKKHQIASVELLDQCTSDSAARAADDTFARTGVREVPLLKFSGVARSSTATCIVTARHVIFVTQFLPLLGAVMGHKVDVFSLKEVDFDLEENAPLMLSALPTVISLEKDGKEVFSFRPSGGGARLKNFLDIIKSIACDSKSLLSS